MTTDNSSESLLFYERSYTNKKIDAQRRYPNEELCRFIGSRHFGKTTKEARADIKILEVGCGSGGNLWMLVREGFDVHGLELSPTAVELCKQTVAPFGKADIRVGNMLHTPYADNFFDMVCDVFSGCCFAHEDYTAFVKEVGRILKPGGLFFFFTPCATSRAFTCHEPAGRLDAYTLDGVHRKDSPYVGNTHPFHFLDADMADDIMAEAGLARVSLSRTTRTHHQLEELFAHLVGVYAKGEQACPGA